MKLIRSLLVAFLAFVSCGSGSTRESVPLPLETPVSDADTTPVILVTIDGVRWQDVFGENARGTLPNLYRVLDSTGTALGAPGYGTVSASGPNFVSLPGYTEIFEGRTNTGCLDNFCNGATIPTLADEIRAQHPSPSSVAVISSWERIAFASTVASSFVISSGSVGAQHEEALTTDTATHRAYVAGRSASAWPGHADYRPDRFTASLALSYLKAQHPAFMFVGLGDTDEYGHRNDRVNYLRSLHEADAFIGSLLDELRSMGERGRRTLVFVTADHGRADNFTDHGGDHPESARSWVIATGAPILARGFIQGTHHLADIAPTIRAIIGMPTNPLSNGKIMTELLSPGS